MSTEPETLHALQKAGPAQDFVTFIRRQGQAQGNDPTQSAIASTAENIGEMIQRAQLTPAEEQARAERIAAGELARQRQQRYVHGGAE